MASGRVLTGWDEDRRLTWTEFCDAHEIDGGRFKYAIEAIIDIPTQRIIGAGPPISLREFANGTDLVLAVDMLLGGEEADLKVCVQCAIFLARHQHYPVPACMQPNIDNQDKRHRRQM